MNNMIVLSVIQVSRWLFAPKELETKLYIIFIRLVSVMLESQQWLDDSIYYIQKYGPGNVVWKHWVNVWVPRDKVLDKDLLDSAILFVDGDNQANKPPAQDDLFVQIGRFLR